MYKSIHVPRYTNNGLSKHNFQSNAKSVGNIQRRTFSLNSHTLGNTSILAKTSLLNTTSSKSQICNIPNSFTCESFQKTCSTHLQLGIHKGAIRLFSSNNTTSSKIKGTSVHRLEKKVFGICILLILLISTARQPYFETWLGQYVFCLNKVLTIQVKSQNTKTKEDTVQFHSVWTRQRCKPNSQMASNQILPSS